MTKTKPWTKAKKTLRRKELLNALREEERPIYKPLVDNLVMLEERLELVRNMPFLRVSKTNPAKQQPTEAAHLFKNLQIEYNSALKYYNIARGGEVDTTSSPLRDYLSVVSERLKNDVD